MSNITDEELMQMEDVLATQIPEAQTNRPSAPVEPEAEVPKNDAASYLGQSLMHKPGENPFNSKEENKKLVEEKHLSKIGDNMFDRAQVAEGWIDVDRALLGERSKFYPEDWQFRIRPATVEAIRNWSTIDDENPNSIDEVFNEIMKSCLSITTPAGLVPWGNINSWDRFFFLLLIREYSFKKGEMKISYDEDCPECDNPVTFELTSQSLMYEYPDPEIMKYYSEEERCWYIDPTEFDVDEPAIKLYLPTLEKDANIKAWMIARLQENNKRKFDQTFIQFLQWMSPKISKDATIANKQIRELEMKYKAWDIEMFSFMDDVLRNIVVTPSTKLINTCPVCGEEVTADIRFPGSIRDLFNVSHKHRKFGKK